MTKLFIFFIGVLLVAACSTGRAKYQVNVGNEHKQLPVKDVKLELDGKTINTFKYIAPKKIAASKPRKGTLPSTLTVSWKDLDGNEFTQSINLDVTTRPDFTGQLALEITKNNNLTLTEVPSSGDDLSSLPWNLPETWEGSVALPGME